MSPNASPTRAPANPTVLFVDDEELVLNVLVRQMRGQPYRILTTRSPAQALDLLASEHIDVMVSDVDMPEMTGLQLAGEARKRFPHVVRILLTGQASLQTAMRAINEGEVFRFLAKPWQVEELAQVLHEASRKRMESTPPVPRAEGPSRHERRVEMLEREHPGMSHVQLTRGVYVVDERRVDALRARLGSPALQPEMPTLVRR